MPSPFFQSYNNKHIRMALANVRSIQKKQNDLNLFLSVYRPEIFSVIETWLTPNDPDNLFLPSGYSFVRRDRATRGGGVAFIINDTIQYKIVSIPSQFSHIEIVSIDVSISKKNYRFISYYRSGGFDKSAEEYAFDSARCIKELSKGDASSRACLIVKCFTSKNKDLLVKAFCSYVRPLLEYCSPLWNPHYKYQITKIEN
ncbi:hypothetical protein HELRODRAFT_184364, partial [Helobdella robusta]|uniref:Uncharacterized protein n=1 Tax=Helobdella robusta TaxID=6412 RepID=T1FL21_HELRO